MTARDVIDQIKALPAEERAKVIDFVEAVKGGNGHVSPAAKDFTAAADWAFKEHADLMRKLSQ